MMRASLPLLGVAGALLISFSALAQDTRTGVFLKRQGYEQAELTVQTLKFKARGGEKTVRVTVSKVRVLEAAKDVPVELPKRGLALIQHAAGKVTVGTEQETFEPLEGEWLRIPLPATLRVTTEKDTALIDLVVIEEIEPGNAPR
jgi:hypothetical protein